jgi:hypothetical protein
MNQTTVISIIEYWTQIGEYPSLAKVLDFSSNKTLDISYRNMTDYDRKNIFPHLSNELILKLPVIGLFQIEKLLVKPSEVLPGIEIQINFMVTNIGEIADIYKIPISVNGEKEDTFINVLSPGESEEILMQIEKFDEGEYSINVADQEAVFKVFVPPDLNPANFVIESIEILPTNIMVGDPITIFVTIFNTGDVLGSDSFELKINSDTIDSQEATVNPLDRITLIFDLALNYGEGVYSVSVNDLSSEIVITSPSMKIPWFTLGSITIIITVIILYLLREREII